MKTIERSMKKSLLGLLLPLLVALPSLAWAQEKTIPKLPVSTPPANANPVFSADNFARFDLDFPGGTPGDLVKMIANASGQPLNVIIRTESADAVMPPIRVREVIVPQLFTALSQASRKEIARISGYTSSMGGSPIPNYSVYTTSYGFFTQGDPTPNAVWYFRRDGPPEIPVPEPPRVNRSRICRFFQLGPYLETYKVEDITTAVETAWKMMGKTNEDSPEIKFHKDTKLLIVVGPEEKVSMIDAVLHSLTLPQTGGVVPATGLPGPMPARPLVPPQRQ